MKILFTKFLLVAALAGGVPGFVRGQAAATDELKGALTEARTQLESLQQRYTNMHPVVRAQQAKIAALERELNGGAVGDAATLRPAVTVSFPGGSLTQLATAIATAGGTFNIIGNAEDVNAAVLPPISVRNADPAALMDSINTLLSPRGIYLERPRRGNEWIEGTYTVYRRTSSLRDGRPAFESFQLSAYLGEQSIDDIVGAMRAAWELDPTHEAGALRLKFHPATGILLASGPEDAIGVVRKVLAQLKRPSPPPPRLVPASPPTPPAPPPLPEKK